MKNYWFLFGFLTAISCDFFVPQKTVQENILEQELQNINWNELDQYPLFETCDETADKLHQKQCFETTLATQLSEMLQKHKLTTRRTLFDTIWIELLINNQGKITIEKIDTLEKEIPGLDSIFKTGIHNLPKLHPPLKRDIPVAAKFKLPIAVHIE